MQLESFYCLPGRLLSYKQCRRCSEAYAADRDKCPNCFPAESTATVQAEAFGPIKQGEAVVIRPDGKAQSARRLRQGDRLRRLAAEIEAGHLNAEISEFPGWRETYDHAAGGMLTDVQPSGRQAILLMLGVPPDEPTIPRSVSETIVEAMRMRSR